LGVVGSLAVAALLCLAAISPGVAVAAPRTDGSISAPAQIAQLATNVPVKTLNAVGAGALATSPPGFELLTLHQRGLTSHGKPELLAEELAWCPHCAANSWAVAIALSRFGTLTGLGILNTGIYDCKIAHDPCVLTPFPCYPFTDGLSFFGASYKSPFLRFTSVVLQNLRGHKLQRPTRHENAAIHRFDSQGSVPVFDIGGRYGLLGVGYDPGALAHKTWSQIAGSLANPHDPLARRIDGFANVLTAAICKTTKGHPRAVCNSGGVRAARGQLRPPPPSEPPQ
jgi:Domain of unknown function (DUF929)